VLIIRGLTIVLNLSCWTVALYSVYLSGTRGPSKNVREVGVGRSSVISKSVRPQQQLFA